jgi:hypothetical protein
VTESEGEWRKKRKNKEEVLEKEAENEQRRKK